MISCDYKMFQILTMEKRQAVVHFEYNKVNKNTIASIHFTGVFVCLIFAWYYTLHIQFLDFHV